MAACGSPVRRASAATSVRRSSRSRSRRSCALSGSVVVNAASAGDGVATGVASANSCIASPGWVVCRTSSSRRALDHSARNASSDSARSARSIASPSLSCSSAWLRSSSICVASRLSVGSDGRNRWLICCFGAGVRRMKRPTTWRKNSSVRALVA